MQHEKTENNVTYNINFSHDITSRSHEKLQDRKKNDFFSDNFTQRKKRKRMESEVVSHLMNMHDTHEKLNTTHEKLREKFSVKSNEKPVKSLKSSTSSSQLKETKQKQVRLSEMGFLKVAKNRNLPGQ